MRWISASARCTASAGLYNEQLNMLHVQIGTLTFPSGFRESSVKRGWWVKRPKYTLIFTKQLERQPAAFHLVWQTGSCRVPNSLHEVSPWSRRPGFLKTPSLIQIATTDFTLGHWETEHGNWSYFFYNDRLNAWRVQLTVWQLNTRLY